MIFTVLGTSVPVRQDRDVGDFSISVNVGVALFNVSVTDSRGRHVGGLKASDFRVLENGRPQEIQLFSAEDVPATIGLVMDNSGSMRSSGRMFNVRRWRLWAPATRPMSCSW
jgi:hypothetical protein